MLQTEMLADLMNEVGPHLAYLNLYFQGEPYLHKGMDELVRLGRKHGVYTSTSTNAHFLRPERCEAIVQSGLNRLIISIDGTTQETYESYRVGGQLDKVVEGTENMLRARKRAKHGLPHVVWQFLVVGPNEHQLSDIKAMAKRVGVDELVVKTAQLDSPVDGHPLLTKDPNLRRYDRNSNGKWSIRNTFRDECWRMWQGCVMTWDGRIVPCCFDKDAEHAMGTFGEQSFNSIWFSAKYDAFRAQIFHARSSVEMCQNCSEGSHVYA
jgi:radical SAM protein with 4Fe4S-binding SPASM domain|tara:strand:- start:4051 stop:4848 length:798 start_codon:yes stop_codon:yes gene_type:complete